MIFEEREKFTFSVLEELLREKAEFVVIGGYAINAYTLPRFSVDCDIVVKDKKTTLAVKKVLESKGFAKKAEGTLPSYSGEFLRFATKKPVLATFDILAETIEDRLTGTLFPAELIFKYSAKRTIFGKGSPIRIEARVADPEMLFVMKAISSRKSDIRDVFMLASTKLDRKKIAEISRQVPIPLESIEKIVSKVNSNGFKDALQGVFGMLPEKQFETTKKKLFYRLNQK
ncbi:MAG: nucleotidyl transferase AbiEii/AbiGii toxin family protein [archaeon]